MRKALGLVAISCTLVAAGVATPMSASAAGGPPSIDTTGPSPVPGDGSVTVTGSGCDAGSPISFYMWRTSGGVPPVFKHSTQTGWLADGAGRFARVIDLDNAFPAGEIGFAASCTPDYDIALASNPGEDGSYGTVTPADPTVDVAVVTQASYGSQPTVTVTTRRATGTITLELDGAVVHTAGSLSGVTSFRLPATLAMGSHQLKATFDEAPLDVAAVVDTATVTVVKVKPVLTLSRAKKRIHSGQTAKLTVMLQAGLAPATGTVQIKQGTKVLKTRTLKAADLGRKTIKVKLTKAGTHKLKATFLGNTYAARATSSKVKVRVV